MQHAPLLAINECARIDFEFTSQPECHLFQALTLINAQYQMPVGNFWRVMASAYGMFFAADYGIADSSYIDAAAAKALMRLLARLPRCRIVGTLPFMLMI